jgi:hypothetical protein
MEFIFRSVFDQTVFVELNVTTCTKISQQKHTTLYHRMSDDFDDDSLSESEALLEQEPRDVDLSNAVANWWLFMEYNQSLWPKDKKELLHLLNSFTHVQHQFSTDHFKLFLFSTKILQMDLQDQQVHFNKGKLYLQPIQLN